MMEEGKKKSGFFCVVYFVLEQEERSDKYGNKRNVITKAKTAYYHKVYKPKKLADYLKNRWYWIKGYNTKQDYLDNKNNWIFIFDKDNPVQDFSYKTFSKN